MSASSDLDGLLRVDELVQRDGIYHRADEARLRPGATDVMALRVGYEKLHEETGWKPLVSWEEGVARTIAWYADNRDRWVGRVDWMKPQEAAAHLPGTELAASLRSPDQD